MATPRPGRRTRAQSNDPGESEEHQRETRRMVEFIAIGLMMNLSLWASFGTPKAPQRTAFWERRAGNRSKEPTASHFLRNVANSPGVEWIFPGGCWGRRPAS